ncbi:protein FAM200A-like [Octopus sinensis]|uniref:Protein FAM200A-like n=1 Tax=Octopus sinensis TaxID=2607531 RepID=A0A6P7U0P5_9MOLL|nr:protein FAM200A-like [Octopus sinensis]
MHSEHVHKSEEFFKRKLEEFDNQTKSLKKLVSVSSNALLASYKVSYRIAKCKKPHNIGETLVLPAAIDMVEAMFGESYAKQLQQIPLADNTVARELMTYLKIFVISWFLDYVTVNLLYKLMRS